jgi:hypothetical protein
LAPAFVTQGRLKPLVHICCSGDYSGSYRCCQW